MKVTGIICEYNPFHNGHLYHIEQTRMQLGSDYIIGLMSGCFTQRGTPAIVDKYSRARMALLGGCDVVLELPVRYATSSAEGFARAAIETLEATGVCNSLSFGTEQGSLEDMKYIAGILENEPLEFKAFLSDKLKAGLSYPAAREQALKDYTGQAAAFSYQPNNILGIEYLRACMNTNIEPFTVKRTDNGYNSIRPADNSDFASAKAVRELILKKLSYEQYVPDYTKQLLNNTVDYEQYASVLYYSLLTNLDKLENYTDMSASIASRIRDNISSFTGVDSFIKAIKTKSYTYTRIARALTHCLLEITPIEDCAVKYPVPYIRILGFRRDSSALMRLIQDNSTLPVISRPARSEELDNVGLMLLEEDIRASELYNHIRYLTGNLAQNTTIINEYTHGIIIV